MERLECLVSGGLLVLEVCTVSASLGRTEKLERLGFRGGVGSTGLTERTGPQGYEGSASQAWTVRMARTARLVHKGIEGRRG
jgi:hypothetical protein